MSMKEETVDWETALDRVIHRMDIDSEFKVDDAALTLAIIFDGIGAVAKSAIQERMIERTKTESIEDT